MNLKLPSDPTLARQAESWMAGHHHERIDIPDDRAERQRQYWAELHAERDRQQAEKYRLRAERIALSRAANAERRRSEANRDAAMLAILREYRRPGQ